MKYLQFNYSFVILMTYFTVKLFTISDLWGCIQFLITDENFFPKNFINFFLFMKRVKMFQNVSHLFVFYVQVSRLFRRAFRIMFKRLSRKQTILLKADDLGVESRRSFEPKQPIFWVQADDLTRADDPTNSFFLTQSRRSW